MSILNKLKGWCLQPKNPYSLRIKRQFFPITVLVVAVLLAVSLWLSIPKLVPPPINQSPAQTPFDAVYQQNIEHFANLLAVQDGKVFVTDNEGNLVCFGAYNGNSLWSAKIGGWNSGLPSIVMQNEKVYTGVGGSAVKAVDENTGEVLQSFQAPVDSSFGQKSSPTVFAVVDERVYVKQDGWAAYNASTGALLWQTRSSSGINPLGMPYTDDLWAFSNNVVLASGIYPVEGKFNSGIYRIDPDIGTVIWHIDGWGTSGDPIAYQDSIIFWNLQKSGTQKYQTITSIDPTSGAELWSFDVGTQIYQPTICQNQLLFGSTEGYFYALNLQDGKLAWKTQILDSQQALLAASVTPVQVDQQNGKIFWGIVHDLVFKDSELVTYNGNNQYTGTFFSVDLVNGKIDWKQQFTGNVTFYVAPSLKPSLGLALLNNTAYVSVGANLWVFSKASGTTLGMETFDHYLLPPVSYDNTAIIVADLKVVAYKDVQL
jgi:outer membrane protein assembly factor BamB